MAPDFRSSVFPSFNPMWLNYYRTDIHRRWRSEKHRNRKASEEGEIERAVREKNEVKDGKKKGCGVMER